MLKESAEVCSIWIGSGTIRRICARDEPRTNRFSPSLGAIEHREVSRAAVAFRQFGC